MKKAMSLALLCAVMALAWSTDSEAASLKNSAYLYNGPGYNHAKVLTVPRGANVGIGDCQRRWCQASYGGQSGYIHQSCISGWGVSGNTGPCRGGPSKCQGSGPSLYTFGLGSALRARGGRGNLLNNRAVVNGFNDVPVN